MINSSNNAVKLKDWISIGEIDAVVCKIYDNNPNKIEIVYLDRNRSINKFAYYIGEKWTFGNEEQYGGYADNNPRLAEYISILKSRRY